MRSVLTRIVSVHFDELPHEWRSVPDQRGHPQLVADILTPPAVDSPHWVHGHRMIIVGEHPYDPAATEATPMLLVALGTGHGETVGAAYYRQLDRTGISGWITANQEPIPDAAEFAFSSQGWNSFPATAVVDARQLRALVTEYLETGRRPECVPSQAAEMVL